MVSNTLKTCFIKYADFSGRASRSEFWEFCLWMVILLAMFISRKVYGYRLREISEVVCNVKPTTISKNVKRVVIQMERDDDLFHDYKNLTEIIKNKVKAI